MVTVTAEPQGAGGKTAVGIGFIAEFTERFFGMGERPARVDQRGARVETYVADGPYYPDAERAVLSAFVPPQGYRQRDDATYFPIPWVLSSLGYGVLVENEETAYHDFSLARQWSAEVTTAPDDFGADQSAPSALRLRVFSGGSPPPSCGASRATSGASPPRPRRGSGARGSSRAGRSRSSSRNSRSCARRTRRSR